MVVFGEGKSTSYGTKDVNSDGAPASAREQCLPGARMDSCRHLKIQLLETEYKVVDFFVKTSTCNRCLND
jgi:hypothetical protein